MKIRVVNTSFVAGLELKETPFIVDAEYVSDEELCVICTIAGKKYTLGPEFEYELVPGQIKPVVAGYQQVGVGGHYFPGASIYSKETATYIAQLDLKRTGIKSKFRPIYVKV